MKKIVISGKLSDSTIILKSGLISSISNYFPVEKSVIITDENVSRYYKKKFPDIPVFTIGQGEEIKNNKTVENIYNFFLENNISRNSFIIAVGGGIVCDIAGYAASTFMRGIDFGFISTTLLSQVDASIGGKNGINFNSYKNMVGTFNQPKEVLIDPAVLSTLPQRELYCGFAEIIKHALIKDKNYFVFLEDNFEKALKTDLNIMEEIIYRSLKIKSEVVHLDEREKGERKKLNFGHTLGHAVEKITRNYNHGEAVSIGMNFAVNLSLKMGKISIETAQKIKNLIKLYNLPLNFDNCKGIISESLYNALIYDKKKINDGIDFILLNDIGEAVIENIPFNKLKEAVNDLC